MFPAILHPRAETGALGPGPTALKQGRGSTLNRGRNRIIAYAEVGALGGAETGAGAFVPRALKRGRKGFPCATLNRGRSIFFQTASNQSLSGTPPLKRGRGHAETGALSLSPALKWGRVCAEAGAQTTLKRGRIYRTEPSLNRPRTFFSKRLPEFQNRDFFQIRFCLGGWRKLFSQRHRIERYPLFRSFFAVTQTLRRPRTSSRWVEGFQQCLASHR